MGRTGKRGPVASRRYMRGLCCAIHKTVATWLPHGARAGRQPDLNKHLNQSRRRHARDALLLLDAGEQLAGVRHLRHRFGIDEAGDLDDGQPGVRQHLDEHALGGCVHVLFLVLQPVARADLHDLDPLRHFVQPVVRVLPELVDPDARALGRGARVPRGQSARGRVTHEQLSMAAGRREARHSSGAANAAAHGCREHARVGVESPQTRRQRLENGAGGSRGEIK